MAIIPLGVLLASCGGIADGKSEAVQEYSALDTEDISRFGNSGGSENDTSPGGDDGAGGGGPDGTNDAFVSTESDSAKAGSLGQATGSVSCATNSECVLVGRICCGWCGKAAVEDYVALPDPVATEYREQLCESQESGSCLTCESSKEASQQNANIFAECVDGSCVVQHLLTSKITECSEHDDCVLIPRDCCPCNASTDISNTIAVSLTQKDGYESWLCEGEEQWCEHCGWRPLAGLSPACVGGRCILLVDF